MLVCGLRAQEGSLLAWARDDDSRRGTARRPASPSGDDENDYEGLVDNNDDHYFGFDLNDSKTKVKGITARLGYACDNDDLVITLVEADGSLKLNDARRFSGVVTFRENPNNKVQYEVRGKLKKQGNAEGTIKGTYEDPFYDTPCKAGEDALARQAGR